MLRFWNSFANYGHTLQCSLNKVNNFSILLKTLGAILWCSILSCPLQTSSFLWDENAAVLEGSVKCSVLYLCSNCDESCDSLFFLFNCYLGLLAELFLLYILVYDLLVLDFDLEWSWSDESYLIWLFYFSFSFAPLLEF